LFRAGVKIDGKWDSSIKRLLKIPPRFERVEAFSDSLAIAYVRGQSFYIERNGWTKIAGQFRQATPFVHGLAAVLLSDKHVAYIDHTGIRQPSTISGDSVNTDFLRWATLATSSPTTVLSHRIATHLNTVRAVNQPVEDAIGHGRIADLSDPPFRRGGCLPLVVQRRSPCGNHSGEAERLSGTGLKLFGFIAPLSKRPMTGYLPFLTLLGSDEHDGAVPAPRSSDDSTRPKNPSSKVVREAA